MGQRRKVYTLEYLEKINNGVLNTASEELYELIIREYPKRISFWQMVEYYDFYEKKNHLIGGLNLPELKALLHECEEQYQLFEIDRDKIYLIYGQNRNTKWFSG